MAVIKKDGNFMGLPMNIKRGNPIPLDTTEIWYSYEEMENYAKTGATAYVGQILGLVTEAAEGVEATATAYIITNTAGDLVEVGAATVGDGKSIELYEDATTGAKTLRLVGFEGAENGAQPIVESGKIVWRKPSTDTVDGLKTTVESHGGRLDTLESEMDAAEGKIGALETKVGSLGNVMNFAGIVADIANKSAADFEPGDVIIEKKTVGTGESAVTVVTEYICVAGEEGAANYWESLGDPQGVEALEGKVASLETWKGTTEGTLTTLTSFQTEAEEAIEALQGKDEDLQEAIDLKAAQSDLETAEGKITTAEGKITTLEGKVSTLETTIETKADTSALNSTKSELEGKINAKANAADVYTSAQVDSKLEDKVDTSVYENKISAMETTIGQNTTTAEAANTLAGQNKTAIEGIQEQLKSMGTSSAIEALSTRVGTAEGKITSLEGSVSSIEGSITSLQNDKAEKSVVEGINGRLQTAEGTITTHTGDISGLKSAVGSSEDEASETGSLYARIASLKAKAAANAGAVEAAQTAANAAQADVDALETVVANYKTSNDAAVKAADDKAVAAQGEVDALEIVVSNLDAAYKTADQALDAKITTINEALQGLSGAMHFKGVKDYVPIDKEGYEDGDVIIVGEKEYVFSGNDFVLFGDVTAEGERIGILEGIVGKPAEGETAASGLVARVDANAASVSANAAALATLQSDLNGLTTRVGTAESDIDALETRMAATEAVANAAATLEALQAEIKRATEAEGKIAQDLATEVTAREALDARVAVTEGQLTWVKFGGVAAE